MSKRNKQIMKYRRRGAATAGPPWPGRPGSDFMAPGRPARRRARNRGRTIPGYYQHTDACGPVACAPGGAAAATRGSSTRRRMPAGRAAPTRGRGVSGASDRQGFPTGRVAGRRRRGVESLRSRDQESQLSGASLGRSPGAPAGGRGRLGRRALAAGRRPAAGRPGRWTARGPESVRVGPSQWIRTGDCERHAWQLLGPVYARAPGLRHLPARARETRASKSGVGPAALVHREQRPVCANFAATLRGGAPSSPR
jgi:hypothetical protein